MVDIAATARNGANQLLAQPHIMSISYLLHGAEHALLCIYTRVWYFDGASAPRWQLGRGLLELT